MYTKYFGLEEKPFSITPDPQFLFLSDRHSEALAHLLYGATESGGFIQLTGEVGTGKTTLTRCLLDRLPENVDLAVILNPRLSVDEFLLTICDELHLDAPADAPSVKNLVDALNRHLLASHEQGRRTVLLVDEAQNLDGEVLEQLRLLTNLETSKSKLLQIILVGQPELRQTLARNDLRQLAQRITGRYHLEALNGEETVAYIQHRLQLAGAQQMIFTPASLWEVFRQTHGIPRLINVLCDRALLGAYSAESELVTPSIVRSAAAEVGGPVAAAPPRRWPGMATAAGVVLAVGVAGILTWGALRSDATPTAAPGSAAVAQSAALATPPPPAATVTEPAPPAAAPVALVATAAGIEKAVELPQEPPAPSLAALLSDPAIDTGTDAAFAELFRLWGVAPDGRGAPCTQARRNGLKCEFQAGSWRLLTSMNRPAILSLVDAAGNLHQAVLTQTDPTTSVLNFGAQRFEVPTRDVRELWYGEYLVFWKPDPRADELMLPGTRSDGVAWLRERLAQVRNETVGADLPNNNFYDGALRAWVENFQRANSLEADGKAGVQTLMRLNTVLASDELPRLSEDDE